MMNNPQTVLQILDGSDRIPSLAAELDVEELDFSSALVTTLPEFVKFVEDRKVDLIITDYNHPTFDGIQAITQTKLINPDIVIIVLTETISEMDAIECIKAGVSNIINVDQISNMLMIVQDALKFRQARLEKRQIEEQLLESEAKFRAMFQNNHAVMLIIDPENGTIVEANPAACQYYGWTDFENNKKNVTDLDVLHPDSVLKKINQQVKENSSYLILKHRIANGEIRDVEIYNGAITIHGKKFLHSIVHDITSKLESERALQMKLQETQAIAQISNALRQAQNEEEFWTAFLEQMKNQFKLLAVGVEVMNEPERKIRLVYQGNKLYDFLPDIEGTLVECYQNSLSEFEKLSLEPDFQDSKSPTYFNCQNKDYKIVYNDINSGGVSLGIGFALLENNHEFSEFEINIIQKMLEIAINGLIRIRMHADLAASYESLQAEIEMRRRIEEQLAKEKEILSISLISIGEAIISTDSAGNIYLYNHAAEEITGYSSTEAIGQPVERVLQILDEKTNQIVPDPISHLVELEKSSEETNKHNRPVLLTKTKQKILIAGKITPIMVDQKIHTGYIIVFDDVTQKELMEAQSNLSSKMESIGQLAAGIAHEINTPIQYLGDNLNYIGRSFDVIKDMNLYQFNLVSSRAEKVISKKDVDDLSQLRKNQNIEHVYSEVPIAIRESLEGIERVRKIVMAIREFSHTSQRENLLSDINKCVLTTMTISRNEWKYCADLETDLEPDLPLVWCRIDELSQVLLNMIINAAHAIQEKQKVINAEKGKIIIKTSHTNDRVFISITDSGCGIPENIVNRIFDPFFTTKEVGKGTGQGLSLAHNIIVNQHHGLIHVETTLNIGTTFTIELPIKQQE